MGYKFNPFTGTLDYYVASTTPGPTGPTGPTGPQGPAGSGMQNIVFSPDGTTAPFDHAFAPHLVATEANFGTPRVLSAADNGTPYDYHYYPVNIGECVSICATEYYGNEVLRMGRYYSGLGNGYAGYVAVGESIDAFALPPYTPGQGEYPPIFLDGATGYGSFAAGSIQLGTVNPTVDPGYWTGIQLGSTQIWDDGGINFNGFYSHGGSVIVSSYSGGINYISLGSLDPGILGGVGTGGSYLWALNGDGSASFANGNALFDATGNLTISNITGDPTTINGVQLSDYGTITAALAHFDGGNIEINSNGGGGYYTSIKLTGNAFTGANIELKETDAGSDWAIGAQADGGGGFVTDRKSFTLVDPNHVNANGWTAQGIPLIVDSNHNFKFNGNSNINGDGTASFAKINSGVLKLNPSSSTPSSPTAGMMYYNSSTGHFMGYTSAGWKQLDN